MNLKFQYISELCKLLARLTDAALRNDTSAFINLARQMAHICNTADKTMTFHVLDTYDDTDDDDL